MHFPIQLLDALQERSDVYKRQVDSYDKVLEITGEITGEIIAPNAEGVDEEGPHLSLIHI